MPPPTRKLAAVLAPDADRRRPSRERRGRVVTLATIAMLALVLSSRSVVIGEALAQRMLSAPTSSSPTARFTPRGTSARFPRAVTPTAPPQSAAIARLPRFHIDPSKVFVAGLSSGGFMAVQMHVAHSRVFKGAAIYAGGVYFCAEGNAGFALSACGGLTLPTGQASYLPTLVQSETYLDLQSQLGTIDSSHNLAGQPVYLWSGTHDRVVNPLEMADLAREYRHYGARVTFDNRFPAEHAWESPDGERACGAPSASPFMISCDLAGKPYDSVRTWLSTFVGPLKARAAAPLRGQFVTFDQSEFGASRANSMDASGLVFVPSSCASGATCRFVLAMHGCDQARSFVGATFAIESGIAEWAETNDIVVLYPYAVASAQVVPFNPKGCFDWWGYNADSNYALKSGIQLAIIYRMVQRVTGAL